MSNVYDLAARRRRHEQREEARREVLHFTDEAEALSWALGIVRDLQRQAGSALLLTAQDLDQPLAYLDAVLDGTSARLRTTHHRETR